MRLVDYKALAAHFFNRELKDFELPEVELHPFVLEQLKMVSLDDADWVKRHNYVNLKENANAQIKNLDKHGKTYWEK